MGNLLGHPDRRQPDRVEPSARAGRGPCRDRGSSRAEGRDVPAAGCPGPDPGQTLAACSRVCWVHLRPADWDRGIDWDLFCQAAVGTGLRRPD